MLCGIAAGKPDIKLKQEEKSMRKFKNVFKGNSIKAAGNGWRARLCNAMTAKSSGIDGLLVTVGLCIIALLLCVVMKDKLEIFIGTIVDSLTQKAVGILG